ncbi:PREDICTED: peroxisomal and mitochondrial division factor 1-like [Nelumbo nucifera]|uniref:Peroxisomal and mitochondrial division factor 1-like n=1 Tax=Nelumbo nucifera TaxID=4432 RepID=A0A1U8Q9H5_NELNU|nr:PREDICTED: peroxisomal and mitochondrial division factor 1-like [Nelumbo nucifera]
MSIERGMENIVHANEVSLYGMEGTGEKVTANDAVEDHLTGCENERLQLEFELKTTKDKVKDLEDELAKKACSEEELKRKLMKKSSPFEDELQKKLHNEEEVKRKLDIAEEKITTKEEALGDSEDLICQHKKLIDYGYKLLIYIKQEKLEIELKLKTTEEKLKDLDDKLKKKLCTEDELKRKLEVAEKNILAKEKAPKDAEVALRQLKRLFESE